VHLEGGSERRPESETAHKHIHKIKEKEKTMKKRQNTEDATDYTQKAMQLATAK
jgi:hypothetical protein